MGDKKELAKTYDPREVEDRIYQFWLDGGYFHAEVNPEKKPYTIVMPPPNITGQLHMGHAVDNTLQDILIRWRRMQGYEALWMPGTDHASIATEAKIVEAMAKEGVRKEDIGREAFLERAWEWRRQYGGRIVQQLHKIGSSCDWERERFTLDEGCSKAVREVFVRLYEEGLIYRGERIINWCPHCHTSISDAEVEFEEQDAFFYHLRYPFADGSGYLELATTRPETMLGDTAVAVHPDDERYRALVGKNLILPLVDKEIPVIADTYVEMDFGTGVVKITPAHDPNDFEVGLRHNLEVITVIDESGIMNEKAGRYQGMTAAECRKAIVKELEEKGYLLKVEPIRHNVGHCYRCHTVIEPLVSMQWFVKMAPLAAPAIDAVRSGKTKFVPERFDKVYFNWMENIRDWCISRQLWWGHRIPAWYCADCGEVVVSREDPAVCPKCGSHHLRQDEDTLDTWFSSALWPFSTLGWPEKTPELDYFYPTDTLVTGYDIIFFWVARMMFSGIAHMGEVPFKNVFIHGLVRDAQGRKMSKSLGNGVDPLEVIDQYGADALRFSLVMGVSAGNDTRYIPARVESARNFANKIWNASRFVLMNVTEKAPLDTAHLTAADQWILSRFQDATRAISSNMEEGEFGLAADRIYDFAWSEFCDWYIELAKSRLNGDDPAAKKAVQGVLLYVLEGLLKLLHPFMPFLTEQVYKFLPGSEGFLMLKSWPEVKPELDFPDEEAKMEGVMEVIRTIRNLRAEMNVAAGKRTHLMLLPADGWAETLAHAGQYFQRLAGASETAIIESSAAVTEKTVSAVTKACTLYIPLGDLVDFEKEIARLSKELDNLHKEIARAEGKLNNPGFVSKAPAALVEQEKGKLALNQQKAEQVEKRIAELKESM